MTEKLTQGETNVLKALIPVLEEFAQNNTGDLIGTSDYFTKVIIETIRDNNPNGNDPKETQLD